MAKIICMLITLVAVTLLGVAASRGANFALLGLASMALWFVWRLARQVQEREDIGRATIEAYAEQNPSCVVGGAVACNECNSNNISPMTDKKHSDYWQHYCRDCGATLFFTKK